VCVCVCVCVCQGPVNKFRGFFIIFFPSGLVKNSTP
jgi:hypothetical protein